MAADAIEEIMVTGSNIKRASLRTPSPTEVVSLESIRQIGAVDGADILQKMPFNYGSENREDTFTQGQNAGTANFNIRGLGLGATLVLINGYRMTKFGLTAADGTAFVNINDIPVNAIGRIEVVKDGSSAIYGSDAVAGVVNFITRKGFEGFELTSSFQTTTENSQQDINVGAVWGAVSDRTTIFTAVNYFSRSFLWARQRSWTDNGQDVVAAGSPGNFIVPGQGFVPDANCVEGGGSILANGRCGTDTRFETPLVPKEKRFSAFFQAEHEATDKLKLSGEFLFTDARPVQSAAFSFPLITPGLPTIPADNPFNPFGVDVRFLGRASTTTNTHPNGQPPGRAPHDHTTWRIVGAAEYAFNDDWSAKIDYNFSRNQILATSDGVVTSRFQALVNGPDDPNFPDKFKSDPRLNRFYNPFGTHLTDPENFGNPQEFYDYIHLDDEITRTTSKQTVVGAVVSGKLLDLPAGPLGVAFGFQYRDESLSSKPSQLLKDGVLDLRRPTFEFSGSLDSYAGFAELAVPAMDNLEMQLALRYEDYGSKTGTTLDPKIAVLWDVMDAVSVRGSFGTSFRAPTPFVRGSRTSVGVLQVNTGKCAGGSTSNTAVSTLTIGNPNLKPEESTSYNFGIAYEKSGLKAHVDYWRYNYKNIITLANVQAIVDADCADNMFTDPRITATGLQITAIDQTFENAGRLETDGLDMSLGYTWNTDKLGSFTVRGLASYLFNYNIQEQPGGVVFNGKGSRNRVRSIGRTAPDWRATITGSWIIGEHSAVATLNLVPSYTDDLNRQRLPVPPKVASYTTLDLQYSYQLRGLLGNDNLAVLSIGAINVFDQDPPFVFDRVAFDAKIADPRGRLIYVKTRLSF
jgi:outer membrane receptor protein involved in Fe transport